MAVGLQDIPLSCVLGQVLLIHLEMTGVMKVFEDATVKVPYVCL